MAVEILRVTPETVAQLQSQPVPFPVIAYVCLEDGKLIGSGGLAWHMERCWLWLGLVDKSHTKPVLVVRWAQRMLRQAAQLGETEVCVERDASEPLAERLLTLLSFVYMEDEPITHDDGSLGELWSARVG